MRKIALVLLAVILVLALAACGQTEKKDEVGMANPWTDVADAQAAADGAEVGYFTVPDKGASLAS